MRVLVVEDHERLAEAVAAGLRGEGMAVGVVFDGQAGPRAGRGHGLGLSIVRAIATAHSADVTARARPEGGLHIEVYFPAIDRLPQS